MRGRLLVAEHVREICESRPPPPPAPPLPPTGVEARRDAIAEQNRSNTNRRAGRAIAARLCVRGLSSAGSFSDFTARGFAPKHVPALSLHRFRNGDTIA